MKTPLSRPAPHESGVRHVTGEALYVDDLGAPPGALFAMPVPSPHARARITVRDSGTAMEVPGVHAVLFAADIPGSNLIGPIVHDEPLLAEDEVFYRGQAVAVVLAENQQACREAAKRIRVTYEPLPSRLTIAEAIRDEAFLTSPHVIERGQPEAALARAAIRFTGEIRSGGQDHFYLETHAALALPGENGTLHVYSSTQHPTEVQKMIASALTMGSHEVVVETPRMGGGFGGKESQATNFAVFAALGARLTGRPCRTWLNRDQDMEWTGKRHPFWTRYEVGFDEQGRILALTAQLYADAGWVVDLSGPIVDRALFHVDNAYFLPDVRIEALACQTHLPSNTAFRGFGGPQGMLVIEDALNRVAERLSLDPAEVRRRNFYGDAPRNLTPYGQLIERNRLPRIWDELMASSDYQRRRDQVAEFNNSSRFVKRGIGFQPIKFGISFTASLLNQAGALVLVYADGSVQLNHGGTEMGQGLHTKMLTVCAHELGVPLHRIRAMNTATDKIPNTSATAASSGSDLNGQAVKAACEAIRTRMAVVAARMFPDGQTVDPESLTFADNRIHGPAGAELSFDAVANQCWVEQVSLSSTGFYRTPGIAYDRQAGQGRPFYYFAYGGAVSEIEVNGLTGEYRLLRVDILHDVGDSLVPTIDVGQVEGGFVQGAGWLTCEEVLFDDQGRLLTHSPSTYKIPAVGDVPTDFRTHLLDRAHQEEVIHGSKAVGEPPFMLAISVVTALRQAVRAFGQGKSEVQLAIPCTPEAVLLAVEEQRRLARAAKDAAK
ncbi:MAG: xanthine dehydrogenase molybdopterin binding subunit [Myxococcota bacterium]|nr:xanthine dehydrogenase molybdopterin binding subunit [Myxococcota bacterium]